MAYVDIDQTTESVTTILGTLDDRTDALRNCFIGTAAPTGDAGPVEGQIWLDNSGTPYVLKLYADFDGGGVTWNEIAVLKELTSDMECSFQQMNDMRLENRGTAQAVSAANEGAVWLLTGDGEVYFVDNGVDNAVKKVIAVVAGTTVERKDIPLSPVGIPSSNPPTQVEIGTTPTIRGYLLDATNEKFTLTTRIPTNYSEDGDLTLVLRVLLNAAETANDDINVTADLVAFADTEAANKTSTQASVDHDIGANNAQYDCHEVPITIDYDDANNPITPNDNLVVEVYLDSVASVAGVVLIGAHLQYPVDGAIQ